MNKNRLAYALLIAMLALLLVAASGCSGFGVGQTGPIKTVDLNIDYPTSQTPLLVISFGAAKLRADAQGEKMLEGQVDYNVIGLNPEITTSSSRVEVRQTSNVNPLGMVNDWNLHFGTAKPIRLEVNAGGYEGDWDLGGIPLRELTVMQGASRSTLDFSRPNPETMSRLLFRTGAASLTLKNLANAGFERMTFEGGVSAYTLDFGGKLQREALVDVKTGLSDLTLIVPMDTAAQVIVRQNVTALTADGAFVRRGDSYYTPAWDTSSGSRLTIEVVAGVGNIDLRAGGSAEL
jgi:hypothetical protein